MYLVAAGIYKRRLAAHGQTLLNCYNPGNVL